MYKSTLPQRVQKALDEVYQKAMQSNLSLEDKQKALNEYTELANSTIKTRADMKEPLRGVGIRAC